MFWKARSITKTRRLIGSRVRFEQRMSLSCSRFKSSITWLSPFGRSWNISPLFLMAKQMSLKSKALIKVTRKLLKIMKKTFMRRSSRSNMTLLLEKELEWRTKTTGKEYLKCKTIRCNRSTNWVSLLTLSRLLVSRNKSNTLFGK